MRPRLRSISEWLRARQSAGALFIRVAFGVHLIRSSYPEVFSPALLRDFAGDLASLGMPFPLAGAYACHITEFFGGIALILGLAVRPVAALLICNFTVAVFWAGWGKPYKDTFQAIQLLAVACFALFHGAGAFSFDHLLSRRRPSVSPG